MNDARTSTAGGPVLAVCGCCIREGDPLEWTVVTCRECGQQCSCVGCVADVEDRGTD